MSAQREEWFDMDPDQLLSDLLDALNEEDREETLQRLTDLREWIERGGFMPADPRSPFKQAWKNGDGPSDTLSVAWLRGESHGE